MPVVKTGAPLTVAEQRRIQGESFIKESSAPLVDGNDPAHRISTHVHQGQPSRFNEARDLPRDPQADAHGRSVLEHSR